MSSDRDPTTTERGYGWRHQQARARALAAFVDGSPCPMCRQPMSRGEELHLDHETPIVLGGDGGDGRLVHARCNTRAGSRLRWALHRKQPVDEQVRLAGWYSSTGVRSSRQWAPDFRWEGPGRPPAGTALGS